MRLQILGSGGYFPNDRRHTACYWLPESAALFDAGTGTYRLLERLQTDELDLFLSHAHLDHITGLTYLMLPFAMGELKTIRLYGTEATLEAVRTHLFSEPIFPVIPEFDFRPLSENARIELSDGGIVTHQPLTSHPGGSTAFRIDWPATGKVPVRSIAYVTDTVVDGTYDDFVRGVDVLLHECNFPDQLAEWAVKTGHSHTTPVAELAREADVGHLYLIHVDAQRTEDDPVGLNVARVIFPETTLAADLMNVKL